MKRNAPLMVMESIWLLAFLLLLDAAFPHPSPILWALLLYPAAYTLACWIPIRDDRLWVELAVSGGILAFILTVVGVALLVVATSGDAGPEAREVGRFVSAALLGAYGWTRGWWRARFDIDAKGFVGNFQFGLAMMIAALFGLSRFEAPITMQTGMVLAFVAAGLFGLSTARPMESTVPDKTRRIANFLAVLAGLAAVFALALLLWLLVDRSALDIVVKAARAVGERLVAFLLDLLPQAAPDAIDAAPPPPPASSFTPKMGDESVELPQGGLIVGPVIVVIATTLVIAVVFIRQIIDFLRRLAGRKRITVGVVYGDAGGSFLIQLRVFLAWLTATLLAAGGSLMARLRRWFTPRRNEGSVRARYRQLLGRLAFRGRRRSPHETPFEYHRRLVPLWPGSDPDFATITDAFVAERYGGKPADPDQVEALWRRLRSVLGKVRRPNG